MAHPTQTGDSLTKRYNRGRNSPVMSISGPNIGHVDRSILGAADFVMT